MGNEYFNVYLFCQLLDCLSIAVVVFLSVLVLKAKYKLVHYIGVFICLAGIGFLVWADITGSRQGPRPGKTEH